MDTTQFLTIAFGLLGGGLAGAVVTLTTIGRWWTADRRRRVRRVEQAVLNELRYNLRAAEYNRVTHRPELLAYRADALRMALFDPSRSIDFGRSVEQIVLAYLDQLEAAAIFFAVNGTVPPKEDAERWRAEAAKTAQLVADRAEQLRTAWKPARAAEVAGVSSLASG